MALTTLDPRSALVVIDLQEGIVAYPTVHPTSVVIERAAQLADAFRAAGLPVILVNVTGGAPGRNEQPPRDLSKMPATFAQLVPQLKPQPSDHLVTKRTWGAFTGTDLQDYLKGQGVTQLVLCGVATSVGVESTARHAYELGFHLTLAIDAMTDMNADAHDNSIQRVFPRLGESGTTAEILQLLKNRRP